MTRVLGRGVVPAAATGLLLHLLLFAAVKPIGSPLTGSPVPPHTFYRGPASPSATDSSGAGAWEVRAVKSPVVFSLPSTMGFSRELDSQDVRTRLSFQQQVRAERFLEIAPSIKAAEERLDPQAWMVSARATEPAVPSRALKGGKERTSSRRVVMAPELMPRLMGGVVLPPELNMGGGKAWEVRASVSISVQGAVEHVFLEQPLESEPLNQQVLRLLYSLRFKPGPAIESSIEIYSPEPESKGEGQE